jgi:regulator of replication initiation timing
MDFDVNDLIYMIGELHVQERIQRNANAQLIEQNDQLQLEIASLRQEEGGQDET